MATVPILALLLFVRQETAPRVEPVAELTLDELVARVPSVDGGAAGSERLEEELERRLKAGVELSNEQWKHLLLENGVLGVHHRWPAGEPFAVSAREPDWLTNVRIVLLPNAEVPGLSDVQIVQHPDGDCWNCWAAGVNASLYQTLGTLPLGRQQISFRIEAWSEKEWWNHVEHRPNRPWFVDYFASEEQRKAADAVRATLEPRPLSTGGLLLEIEIVPTLDDAIPPVSTPELDRAVAQALSVAFVEEDGERWAELVLSDEPALEHLGLSLDVELLEGAESRLSTHVCTHDRDPWHFGAGTGVTLPLPPELEHDIAARRAWSLRVRGTDERILRDWDAERRWSGTLVLGMDELLERGEALRKR